MKQKEAWWYSFLVDATGVFLFIVTFSCLWFGGLGVVGVLMKAGVLTEAMISGVFG
jgi:hypothetical protein